MLYVLNALCSRLSSSRLCIPVVTGTTFSITNVKAALWSPFNRTPLLHFLGSHDIITEEMMVKCLERYFGPKAAFTKEVFAPLRGRAVFFFKNFLPQFAKLPNTEDKFSLDRVQAEVRRAWASCTALAFKIVSSYASNARATEVGRTTVHGVTELVWADRFRDGVIRMDNIGSGKEKDVDAVVVSGMLPAYSTS